MIYPELSGLPKHVVKVANKWALMAPKMKEKILEAFEKYLSDAFFAGGAGKEVPLMPEVLQKLDPRVLGYLMGCVDPDWRKELFNQGWLSRPEEERKKITDEIRAQREAMKVYDHLPVDGATLPDGTHVPIEGLKQMVDQGLLPPNPNAVKVGNPLESRLLVDPAHPITLN